MKDLTGLIARVKLGDERAYEPIVRRFQDMAVDYGYATLGDWQLAEDAAQEAFIAAYCELPALRDQQAFPGWFRRIVIKQIDRIRRRRPRDVVLDELSKVPADQHSPSEVAEQQELHDSIVNAIHSLPTPQSNCVVCQAPEASTTADLQGAMWQRMALSMRTKECMHATSATFLGLPAWSRRW